MPSSLRPASRLDRARILQLLVVAALTLAVRLPFLLHGERFFDSDEAVEGLMTRHLLHGEYPIYLWGQQYKGVPEVYLAGLFFAAAGPTVVALKAATLACFMAFVCLQFALVQRLSSARIAWLTTGFLIVGPPSLVLWTLSANAEVVMTLLAGAVLGHGLERWRRTGSLTALTVAGVAIGFAFWVQQYIVYYLVSLGVVGFLALPEKRARARAFLAAAAAPRWARVALHMILAAATVYMLLGAVAFLTGGFDVSITGVPIGARNPQKLWRIGAGFLLVYLVARVIRLMATDHARQLRREVAAAGAGVLIGYLPALLALQGGGSAPMGRTDIQRLRAVSAAIAQEVVPIVLGFRSPTTEWLAVSGWFAVLIILTVMVSYAAIRERRMTPYFHVFLIVTPLLFVFSGSYVDAQSYRYLMPLYAAIPVVLAVGVDRVIQWQRVVGAVVLTGLIGMFAAQEAAWYRRLAPDTKSAAILACLRQSQVRGLFADYWLSYKLTFLSGEAIIVAPSNGVDRYQPYRTFVQAQGTVEPCHSILVQ